MLGKTVDNEAIEIKDTDTKVEDKVEEPKIDNPTTVTDDDIIDIDLSVTDKKTFRINGDNTKLIKLNPSDVSVITRIEGAENKFAKCIEDLQELANKPSETEEDLIAIGDEFSKIDDKMRELVDYIFQSNVSEVCVPKGSGSMYDPFNGKYRYEHIIEALLNFYSSNIQAEHKKMQKAVSKKTAPYTKAKKR